VSPNRILAEVRRFEALGSRMTGTAGADAAADMIETRFHELGLQGVTRQSFDVVVPITHDAGLSVAGEHFVIHPLWPNGVRTASIDGDLHGPLVWAESGRLESFNGMDMAGSIVVLEQDLGVDWFHAPMLGARAILFLESDQATRTQMEYKFSSLPMNTPRFWVSGDDAARLRQTARASRAATVEAVLTCRVDWEVRQGHNILAFLPAADRSEPQSTIAVQAYYDAISAVPDLAPGAENGLNAALLLVLAEELAVQRPAHPILFVALAGHYQALRGARVFADLWRHRNGASLDARISELTESLARMAPSHLEIQQQLRGLAADSGARLRDALAAAAGLKAGTFAAASQMPVLERIRVDVQSVVESGTDMQNETAGELLQLLNVVTAREVRANKARIEYSRLQSHRQTIEQLSADVLDRVAFVYGLDLSSHSASIGLFFKGFFVDQFERNYETALRQVSSPLAYRAAALARQILTDTGLDGSGAEFVDGVNLTGGLTWQSHMPLPLGLDIEMPLLAGLPGAALVTTGDPRIWVDTPHDRVGRMDSSRLALQTRLLFPLLQQLLGDPEVSQLYRDIERDALLPTERFRRMHGRTVAYDPARSLGAADQPVAGALLTVQHNPGYYTRNRVYKTYGGVRNLDMTFADGGGFFEFIGLPDARAKYWDRKQHTLEAYRLDAISGRITHAPDRGAFGEKAFAVTKLVFNRGEREVTPVLFACEAVTIVGTTDQRTWETFDNLVVYDARSGSAPQSWGYKAVGRITGQTFTEPAATLFLPPGMRFKARFGKGSQSAVAGSMLPLLHVPESGEPADGLGYLVPPHGILTNTPLRMAEDLWRLNEGRLSLLRRHGVRNAHLEALHDGAGVKLRGAQQASVDRRFDESLRQARASWSLEAKAYPEVRGTTVDVLLGVIFYLFLLIPFAFFGERLIFGCVEVNRQIAGFFGIFFASFLILSLVHPAFAITNSAPVILLSFITLTLAVMVIAMIRSRFQQEIFSLQQRPGSGAGSDLSRLSAAQAAFALGVDNMRRRKMRTVLTISTLVLLMFSVLSFSSIESRLDFHRRPISTGVTPPYQGALVRQPNWGTMALSAHASLDNRFPAADGHAVAPRSWIVSEQANVATGVRLQNPLRGTEFRLTGLVGMTPEERAITRPQERLVWGRWMQAGEKHVCVLPEKVFYALELERGSQPPPQVYVYGMLLEVIGVFGDDALMDWKDLDGEPLSPVDYSVENWQRHFGSNRDQDSQFYHYVHLDARNVLFAPHELLLDHGGTLRSISLLPESLAGPVMLELGLLKETDLPVFLASDQGVTYVRSTRGSAAAGFAALLIPMSIAALIVLNTMLGSVYERESEISIYGAMGLAPVHISSLFMAESCVFATLSAVSGYILGQVVAKVITMQGLLSGLSLNYSSTAAVVSALFIVGIVLLSTLYPARRAAALAVPDVDRVWKLPEPQGDLLDIHFPFTIGPRDVVGINGYLLFFLTDHSRQSVGDFYTDGNSLTRCKSPHGAGFQLNSDLWIAPFDFGISQSLEIQTLPSADPRVFETRMQLVRKSGDRDAWVKMNNRFLKHLRKQFLLWRLLTVEDRDFYRDEAEGVLA
jgi:hypothetical protein